MDALQRHIDDGKPLRVLTTVFTGSTEAESIEALLRLGAQVRVSYDTTAPASRQGMALSPRLGLLHGVRRVVEFDALGAGKRP